MSAAGSVLDLSLPQLALALLLVGVVILISVRQGLGIGGDLVVGSLRAVIQLYLVGLILAVVFHAAGWYWVLLILAVMTAVAAQAATSRLAKPIPGARGIAALALTVSRRKGVPNKYGTIISEVFRNLLGLDDAAVEATGMIDRPGFGARRRLAEMFRGERDVDPNFVGLLKVALSYAYGTPLKMKPNEAGAFARRLAFITPQGLPWESDPLYTREKRMIEQQRNLHRDDEHLEGTVARVVIARPQGRHPVRGGQESGDRSGHRHQVRACRQAESCHQPGRSLSKCVSAF